jgi:hypothetical protein
MTPGFTPPSGETILYEIHESFLDSPTDKLTMIRDGRAVPIVVVTAELIGDNIVLRGYTVRKLGPGDVASRFGAYGEYTIDCAGTILQGDFMSMCDIGDAIGQVTTNLAGFSAFRPLTPAGLE